jgi:hypothetical protein
MNDIDKDIYKKYGHSQRRQPLGYRAPRGQLNIKNNTQISQINNIEINNNIDFFKFNSLTPYCDTTYNLFKTKTDVIVPYNENLNINEYCNK